MQTESTDSLGILASVKSVMDGSKFVRINENNLDTLTKKVLERFGKGLDTLDQGFDSTSDTESDIQLIFVETCVNFCFWPDKDNPKWEVEWPKGNKAGGWYGLVNCFKRALAEEVPVLDAGYLAEISTDDAKNIFRGENNTDIPLLTKRVKDLREAGLVLMQKFGGRFSNALEEANYDAVELVGLIVREFPSFRDISLLDGKEIFFLKRAQICPNDLDYALRKTKPITRLNELTAFADYKLPQILRMFDILEYESGLAEKVDSMTEIPHDSREEIEIRVASVWAVELLRRKIGTLTAGNIDNVLWLLSQDIQSEAKPYHRTRTIFY